MNIVVLVKQVPDTYGERTLRGDGRIDRERDTPALDEIDERALEVALRLRETAGGEVTVLTMGPPEAVVALRKALAMGADRAVHVCDEALAGSDALQTAAVLAAAVRATAAPGAATFDLVVAGNESTDGRTAAVPAMLAERLGLPQLTFLGSVAVDAGIVTGLRITPEGTTELCAALPAVISVTEGSAQPRFPNFKGIMSARSKPLTTLTLADLADHGLVEAEAGGANSWSLVCTVTARPARAGGTVISDDGTGGSRIAAFLAAANLI
ncbi:electron transfer flavoprotein beta subunit/FixA family protein [Cryobacterium sp. TMT2-10]|uniref:electron transfer flavoprotein subunit beta/FixA family protein n=1 Tax=Cryobacterium sp. TMT2-10 TaxID=1259244 RepID=UPI00106DC78E|nr:electron transfer flavoprotein subunit beta/FixA family protein [Cryobacterium sp. TMT2-10]TFD39369.1 electron transfer flavoprotein beta subunit/FixA family protein [Cryobacterium sp. TMT2-10]